MKSTLTKFVIGGVAASMLTLGVSADTLTHQNGAPVGDNQNSQTALMFASLFNREEIVSSFIEKGANPQHLDKSGNSLADVALSQETTHWRRH